MRLDWNNWGVFERERVTTQEKKDGETLRRLSLVLTGISWEYEEREKERERERERVDTPPFFFS